MVKRSQSEANILTKELSNLKRAEKKRDKEYFKENVAKMNSLVRSLENTILESQKSNENIRKNEKKVEEARKENKQLLNVIQQQCSNHELSVSRSQEGVSPSYSTVSMVHLQYKYEELLSSHEGLLKLLEVKVKEVRKCYNDNERLSSELRSAKRKIDEQQGVINMICNKYTSLKQRKDRKIRRLKFERDTVKVAHDKLVHLLHQKCMEQDENLFNQLGRTSDCLKSLLLNEIRKANKLQYENVILNHKNSYLTAKFGSKTEIILQ